MKRTKTIGVLFLIIAVVSIIFACVSFSLETGTEGVYMSYGGDAYTGIQNSAVRTANNVNVLTRSVNTISGLAFIILGLIVGTVGVFFLQSENNDVKEKEETNI